MSCTKVIGLLIIMCLCILFSDINLLRISVFLNKQAFISYFSVDYLFQLKIFLNCQHDSDTIDTYPMSFLMKLQDTNICSQQQNDKISFHF